MDTTEHNETRHGLSMLVIQVVFKKILMSYRIFRYHNTFSKSSGLWKKFYYNSIWSHSLSFWKTDLKL